jgi:RecA-family ATPase
VANSVRIVRLPGLGYREDVEDWLDAGNSGEELIDICAAAPVLGVKMFNVAGLDDQAVPTQEWVIENRIPNRCVALLSGEGAAGKSTIALHQSSAHTIGREYLGVVPRQGPALFIDAEDDTGVIHRRLDAVRRHYGVTYQELSDGGLNIWSLTGQDAVLAATSRSGRIEPTALYRELLERVGDTKPVLTTIASSANVFAGNENDRPQVQQFVDLLTRVAVAADGAVVLISHPSLTGMQSDSGLSGSTQWHNAVRARLYLKGVKEERGEPTTDMRVLECRKNNYGPITERILLRYQNGLFLPVLGATVDMAERHQQAEEVYVEILRLLVGQGHDLSANKKSGNAYAVAMVYQHTKGKFFVDRNEVEAAQQRLLDANKIHIEEQGSASKKRKRILPGPGPEQGVGPM